MRLYPIVGGKMMIPKPKDETDARESMIREQTIAETAVMFRVIGAKNSVQCRRIIDDEEGGEPTDSELKEREDALKAWRLWSSWWDSLSKNPAVGWEYLARLLHHCAESPVLMEIVRQEFTLDKFERYADRSNDRGES